MYREEVQLKHKRCESRRLFESVWKKITAVVSVVAVFFASTVLIPSATAQEASPSPSPGGSSDQSIAKITGGEVTWGIKKSWRNYISKADTIYKDIKLAPTGEYIWPIKSGTYDPKTKSLHLDLDGSIHYRFYKTGDIFLLNLKISNLQVDINPQRQVISGDYAGTTRDKPGIINDLGHIELAKIDLSKSDPQIKDGQTTWSEIPVYNSGIPLYESGIKIDPITITYKGPGGKPSIDNVDDNLKVPGAPVFSEPSAAPTGLPDKQSSTWSAALKDNNYFLFYAKYNNPRNIPTYSAKLFGGSAFHELANLDLGTCSGRRLPDIVGAYDGDRYVYIPVCDEKDKSAVTLIRRISVSNGELAIDKSWELKVPLDNGKSLNALNWDQVRHRLIVGVTPADGVLDNAGVISLVDPSHPDLSTQSFVVPLDTYNLTGWDPDTYSHFPKTTISSFGGPYTGSPSQPVVLEDGTYLWPASNGTYQNQSHQPFDGRAPILSGWIIPNPGIMNTAYLLSTLPDPGSSRNFDTNGYSEVLPLGNNAFLAADSYSDRDNGKIFKVHPHTTATELQAKVEFPPNFDQATAAIGGNRGGKFVYYLHLLSANLDAFSATTGKYLGQIGKGFFTNQRSGAAYPVVELPDGSVVVQGVDTDNINIVLYKLKYLGDAPVLDSQLHDLHADLGFNDETTVDVSVHGNKTGGPATTWQIKRPGDLSFSTIPGVTGDTAQLPVDLKDNGAQVRAIYSNQFASIASNPVTLTVIQAPRVLTQPLSVSRTIGQGASFSASFSGTPQAHISWQTFDNNSGLWTSVATDNPDLHEVTTDGTSVFEIRSVSKQMDHLTIRAVGSNESGNVASDPVTLTVLGAPDIKPSGSEITGVNLAWGISGEVQKKPPFGESNYISVGQSDGSQRTYADTNDNVEVYCADKSDPFKADFKVAFDTRTECLKRNETQTVLLSNGSGTIKPDGSAVISWPGTFSLNFYDGLVPTTFTNVRLQVNKDGDGELVGDLSGFGATQSDPFNKHVIDPAKDVPLAVFHAGKLSPVGTTTFAPEYAGIRVTVPSDQGFKPQVTSGSGWGSWPQKFVDFQFKTGLSSYWYSSSESDTVADKGPLPIQLSFKDAKLDGVAIGNGTPVDSQPTPAPNPPAQTGGDSGSSGASLTSVFALIASLTAVVSSTTAIIVAVLSNPHSIFAEMLRRLGVPLPAAQSGNT